MPNDHETPNDETEQTPKEQTPKEQTPDEQFAELIRENIATRRDALDRFIGMPWAKPEPEKEDE